MTRLVEIVLRKAAYNLRVDGVFDSAPRLKRIAVALGEPEANFFDGSQSLTHLNTTCEMLRVWDALEDAEDRQKVLAFARSLTMRA